jgi:hypothetical protein
MAKRKVMYVKSFPAVDAGGKTHMVEIWKRDISGGGAWPRTELFIGLAAVRRIGKGVYEVTATGVKLTSESPDAA